MGRTFELLIQQSKIWNMVLETVGRRKLKLTRALMRKWIWMKYNIGISDTNTSKLTISQS
jgi:hypothetical protein